MTKVVFPGTFDPIHYGHIDIALRASRLFDEVVVAVFDRPLKNLLFSPEERLSFVKKSFENVANISVVGYSGLTVTFVKSIGAQAIVRGLRVFSDFEHEFKMALANHRLSPDIDVVALITSDEHTFLSSTTVREIASLGGDITTFVQPHVADALYRKFRELGNDQTVVPLTALRD